MHGGVPGGDVPRGVPLGCVPGGDVPGGARRTSVVSSETRPLLMSSASFSVLAAIEASSFSASGTLAAGTWHEARGEALRSGE